MAAKEKTGRKLKLTPEVIKEASTILAAGNYETVAIEYIGVDQGTWYRWKADGKKHFESGKKSIQREFYEAIKKATAKCEISSVAIILSASKKQWQAAAWLLERKFGERWAMKQDTTANDGSINALVEAIRKSEKPSNEDKPEKPDKNS